LCALFLPAYLEAVARCGAGASKCETARGVFERVWTAVAAGVVRDLGGGADPGVRAASVVGAHTAEITIRVAWAVELCVSERYDVLYARLRGRCPNLDAGTCAGDHRVGAGVRISGGDHQLPASVVSGVFQAR